MAETNMNIETLEELKEALIAEIKSRDERYEPVINKVKKDNGTFTGLTLKTPGVNVAPTIYLENGLADIENGVDEEEVVKTMVDVLVKASFDQSVDLDYVRDYENVKDKLSFQVVNESKNLEMLEQCISAKTDYDDIVMIPVIKVVNINGIDGVIKVTKQLADCWDIKAADIITDALTNAPKIDKFNLMEFPKMPGFEDYIPPFEIMTTEAAAKGSVVLMYDEFKQYLDENYKDGAYIIPSSVHEILVMEPHGMFGEKEEIRNIIEVVNVVNSTTIRDEDFLSNKVYTYKDGKVKAYDKSEF